MDEFFDTVDLSDAKAVLKLLDIAFATMPDRLAHVQVVASEVKKTAETLLGYGHEVDVDKAFRAALLHDIGYAAVLIDTGFHPIDGARYLERRGYPAMAADIVCHSNSPEQAQLRGLPEIFVVRTLIADLITFWDVRVKQGGALVSYEERLSDIRSRYGADSPVLQAHMLAAPRIESIIERVQTLLNRGR